MPDIKELTNLIKPLSSSDLDLINKAFSFAQNKHKGQERFSREPYFVHVFEVAKILAEINMSPTVIAAGLLHDVIEDAQASEQEIKEKFGEEINFLVNGVTKLGKLKYRGAVRHKESLRKFFVAVSQDIRVIIIKLADRLHNIKTLKYVPEHKQKRIAQETLEIYVPVAYRLGIRKLSRQLEDLSFPYVLPEEYKKTKNLIEIKHKKEEYKLEEFEKSIKKALAKNKVTEFHTTYRIKTYYSIYQKLLRKYWNIEKIYDIFALRIILPEISDCYNVLGIVHGIWRPLPGRIKDYIAFPKPNGYQALHTTIFTGYGNILEIQIKNKKMHQEAEYGIASHVFYKDNNLNSFSWIKKLLPFNNIKNSTKTNFEDIPSWIKELVAYQKTQATEKELKDDFFKKRIFVFTPKGDVIDLPVNSTPLDFAYAIHSDVGNHVGEVKINGKMGSLDTPLQNGDIIEVITKKTSKPSSKWLDIAKTATARKNIKSYLQK